MKKNVFGQSVRAFTLVEMLVVIAIIAILGIAAYFGVTAYQNKTVNDRREADLQAIATALDQYYQDNQYYPHPAGNLKLIAADTSEVHNLNQAYIVQGEIDSNTLPGKYISPVPVDPQTHHRYAYAVVVSNIVGEKVQGRYYALGTISQGLTGYNGRVLSNFPANTSLLSIVRSYNGSQFVVNDQPYLPYDPEVYVVSAAVKVTDPSAGDGMVIHFKNGVTQAYKKNETVTLYEGDTINTCPAAGCNGTGNGLAEIYYSDGSFSRLDAGTQLALKNMSYKNTGGTLVGILVSAGRVWNRVVKLDQSSDGSEFNVEAADGAIVVRGTAFGLQVDNSTLARVYLSKGKVDLKDSLAATDVRKVIAENCTGIANCVPAGVVYDNRGTPVTDAVFSDWKDDQLKRDSDLYLKNTMRPKILGTVAGVANGGIICGDSITTGTNANVAISSIPDPLTFQIIPFQTPTGQSAAVNRYVSGFEIKEIGNNSNSDLALFRIAATIPIINPTAGQPTYVGTGNAGLNGEGEGGVRVPAGTQLVLVETTEGYVRGPVPVTQLNELDYPAVANQATSSPDSTVVNSSDLVCNFTVPKSAIANKTVAIRAIDILGNKSAYSLPFALGENGSFLSTNLLGLQRTDPTATVSVCGNGIVELNEECDGLAGLTNPARQTCTTAASNINVNGAIQVCRILNQSYLYPVSVMQVRQGSSIGVTQNVSFEPGTGNTPDNFTLSLDNNGYNWVTLSNNTLTAQPGFGVRPGIYEGQVTLLQNGTAKDTTNVVVAVESQRPTVDVLGITAQTGSTTVSLPSTVTIAAGSPVTLKCLASNAATYTWDTAPAVVGSNNGDTLTLSAPAAGTYAVTCTGRDSDDNEDSVTANLAVQNINQAPAANEQNVNVAFQTPQVITLVGNDPDNGPEALTYTIVANPANGTLNTRNLPNVTYTPNTSFSGSDTFTFKTFDGADYSAPATVNVTVGIPPAPTVSITNPTSGATFTAGTSIPINLNINSQGNTLTKVEYYNPAPLTTVTTAPYNWTWPGAYVSAGSYTLTAKLYYGSGSSVTSAPVSITVNPAPVAPTITTQPVNKTVTAGQTAAFSVVAAGTAPLSYQWQKNGVNISGATSSTYTTPATILSDSGAQFKVVITNAGGSVTSTVATLTVNPSDTTPPTGSVSVSAGATYTKTTSVTLTTNASDASGVSQMQFSNDGTNYSTWETYSTSKSWTLTVGDGTKTVYAKFKDTVGNVSAAVSDTIVLDSTLPVCGTWSPNPAPLSGGSSQTFTLSGSTDAGSGIATAGGVCNATANGTSCNVAIADNAGNSQSCASPAANLDPNLLFYASYDNGSSASADYPSGRAPTAGTATVSGGWANMGTSGLTYAVTNQDIISATSGRIEMVIKPNWNGNDGQNHKIFQLGGSSNNITLDKNTLNEIRFKIVDNTGKLGYVQANISSWTVGSTHTLIATWNNLGVLNFSVDGVTATGYSTSGAVNFDSQTGTGYSGLNGSSWTNAVVGDTLNGLLDYLRISK